MLPSAIERKRGSIMRRPLFHRHVAALLLLSACVLMPRSARADTWRGTAPFCSGECKPGEVQKGVSDSGDGGYCVTGHKVLCGNAAQTCPVRETKTKCYGAVMVCDNGFYESPTKNWHSCAKYACGICLGFESAPGNTPRSFTADICKQ